MALFGFSVPPADIIPTKQVKELKEKKDRKKFLTDVGHSESRNDYTKVNKYLTRRKGSHRQDIEKAIHVLQMQIEFYDRHKKDNSL